jgi:carbamate kinase
VIAIGGNSLIKDSRHQTVPDQYQAARETCGHIAKLIKNGWNVAISHGNGPQVGFILRRSELASHELHEVPLDVCGADSQGAIGYALQQNLYNYFRQLGLDKTAVTVVTQVEVSTADPAFQNPTKPIGSFMDEEKARRRRNQEGWHVVEDAGRGWRRVVPSPLPVRIVEEKIIKDLITAGVVTIAVGGGGIPVVADDQGNLRGVAAVIDKDYASALLANVLNAEIFIISTAVEKVALNYRQADEVWLDHLSLAQAKAYIAEGKHFAKGSMAPKIQAVINYLERGGGRAIITNPENIERAVAGETGTHITP